MQHAETTIGILAHVDAGKTTLSEALLYHTGAIRAQGRVDHGTAFLDYDAVERKRGITISAKQAHFSVNARRFTLIDTPGHADLAPEMERVLGVLDAAILVVSATDGVQTHTETIWSLLQKKGIATLVFINKTDCDTADVARAHAQLCALGMPCSSILQADPKNTLPPQLVEDIASQQESWLEDWLGGDTAQETWVQRGQALVAQGKLCPCIAGAALTGAGIETLLQALCLLAPAAHPVSFPAIQIYKITHDAQGRKVALLKVLGGALRPKSVLYAAASPEVPEKIDELWSMSGEKTTPLPLATSGVVCAAIGFSPTAAPGLYVANPADAPPHYQPESAHIQPVMEVAIDLPDDVSDHWMLEKLRMLEQEQPELSVRADSNTGDLLVRVMGTIHMEVLAQAFAERFAVPLLFGAPRILYKETIQGSIIGYGHYEPLRHYAEVKLRLDAGAAGQGILADSTCHIEQLSKNYQSQVRTHILEKTHLGVLTGSPLTDVTITLLAGQAYNPETKGGDFREATYRAIRQALMKANNVLLEPWYQFCIKVPAASVGRAIADVLHASGRVDAQQAHMDGTTSLTGIVPVATFMDYPIVLAGYTKGAGSVTLTSGPYLPCHNADEVIQHIGYEPERDLANTPNSIFFAKGAGYEVKWFDVEHLHHLE